MTPHQISAARMPEEEEAEARLHEVCAWNVPGPTPSASFTFELLLGMRERLGLRAVEHAIVRVLSLNECDGHTLASSVMKPLDVHGSMGGFIQHSSRNPKDRHPHLEEKLKRWFGKRRDQTMEGMEASGTPADKDALDKMLRELVFISLGGGQEEAELRLPDILASTRDQFDERSMFWAASIALVRSVEDFWEFSDNLMRVHLFDRDRRVFTGLVLGVMYNANGFREPRPKVLDALQYERAYDFESGKRTGSIISDLDDIPNPRLKEWFNEAIRP